MDFTPTPGQTDAGELARRILTDRCTPARLTELEHSGERFDRALWRELGDAGLLGLALPEEHGGAGLTLLEAAAVCEEVGRAVAPLPVTTHVAAALILARSGVAADLVAAAASGETVLCGALAEDHAALPDIPLTTASREADGYRVTGAKSAVPGAAVADAFLVPAATDDGVRLFLVRRDDAGVSLAPQQVTGGEPAARLELDGVVLGEDRVVGATDAATSLRQHLVVLLAAEQLGVCDGGLRLTAQYARTREQFDRPIGSFQAVSQRLADCYIDVQGLRLTVTSAAWRLAEGLPADVEVASAALWATDTGHKVAHATVHVHGGVGIDLDGTAHRYFTAAKRLELALGGTTLRARDVGRILAAEPV